jgi:hypothetical protein
LAYAFYRYNCASTKEERRRFVPTAMIWLQVLRTYHLANASAEAPSPAAQRGGICR